VFTAPDHDVPAAIDDDAFAFVNLPAPAVLAAPLREEGPGVRELLDAEVAAVADEDVPAPIDGDAFGVEKLSVGRAVAPPRGEESAARVELLDAVVAGV